MMRRLYDWILGLAETKYAVAALALLAFAESSFFPIPPDVLLLALCLGAPARSLRYAFVCSIASVLGGIGGYSIGYAFEPFGRWIITHVASPEKFDVVAGMYGEDAFFYVCVAAFTPIPYKVFTIAAGMFHESVPLSTLVLASLLGRSARFFLVAGLVWKFGPPVKYFIDRHFNRLMWTFLVLLVLGFAAIKFVGGHSELTLADTLNKLDSNNVSVRILKVQEIEQRAGTTFGLDPAHLGGDPRNAEARKRLEEWFATRERQE